MNQPFRIENKESFRVIGYKLTTTNKKRMGQKEIPLFWEKFKAENKTDEVMSRMNQEPYGLFGINVYNVDETDARKFNYYIAVSSDIKTNETLESYHVPENTWAVFPCTLDTIGKTEALAITKWLPKSEYRPLNKGYLFGKMKSKAPDIEYYGKDGKVEVWIAVTKK